MINNETMLIESKGKIKKIIDLGIIFIFLPLSFPLYIIFGGYIDNNSDFISVILLSIIEFFAAGLGAFVIIFVRKESFSEYGIRRDNFIKSLGIGLLFILAMILIKSVKAGEFLYFPMRNHTVMRYSLSLVFPLNIIGILITLLTWGIIEGIYYVVIIKKIDDIFYMKRKMCFFIAPIIFFIYNFSIHYFIRVFIEGRAYMFSAIDIFLGLMLAFAMFIPLKVTNNSWASLIYQTIQNGLGRI
ncbi:hypothetical protein [Vallitalea okinawensis]|uniref:hypothetical protein n=1 Tax=Vallitalea okinawensis TaxID=2078660 RepID=UPI000CFBF096|nr:hypothetical protein [Vallitalea okinawensis]